MRISSYIDDDNWHKECIFINYPLESFNVFYNLNNFLVLSLNVLSTSYFHLTGLSVRWLLQFRRHIGLYTTYKQFLWVGSTKVESRATILFSSITTSKFLFNVFEYFLNIHIFLCKFNRYNQSYLVISILIRINQLFLFCMVGNVFTLNFMHK